MTDENYLKEVREHYENYPYPPKNPHDEKERLLIPITDAPERMNYFCFSGKRDFKKPFRALVAGGGTGDTIIALAELFQDNPDAELVYLDMSNASMAIAQECLRVRKLDNVTWIHDSLLNIPKLGLGQFDYVNCSGVLHHLEDPDGGLRILADSIKEDGCMAVMVYAKYGRMAVYQMQETMRLLNKDEPNLQKRVDRTRVLLSNLPDTNWFLHSPRAIIHETINDIGIYDLLLHSQDRAYSVPELYDFVEKAGLKIAALFSDDRRIAGNLYNPLSYLVDKELASQAQKLSLKEQQTLAELLNGHIIKHTIYAAKKIAPPPNPGDLEVIPLFAWTVAGQREKLADIVNQSGEVVVIDYAFTNSKVLLLKTPHLEHFFRYADGRRPLREIFRRIMDTPSKGEKPNFQTLMEEFLAMFSTLNRYEWMYLREKCSSYPPSPWELQDRVHKLYEHEKVDADASAK